MFGSVARPLLAVAVATLIGGIALLAPPVARGASDGLRIVTQTRYVALPSEKRIHVTVQARATNATADPPNGRYYYDGGWNKVGVMALALSGAISIGWELSTQLFQILPDNNFGWLIGASAGAVIYYVMMRIANRT